MRRFFSFRSSRSTSVNSSPTPPDSNNEEVYWETPWENSVPESRKVLDCSKIPKNSSLKLPLEQDPGNEDACNSHHRRSASCSSPVIYSELGERNLNSSSDGSRSPSVFRNPPHVVAGCPIHCHSLDLERPVKIRRDDLAAVRQSHPAENLDSPSSSRGHYCSSGNSPRSSPIPLRCRAARFQQIRNNNRTVDLYIDGEQQEIEPAKDYQELFSDSRNDGFLDENKAPSCLGRPPRAPSTAPSSPTHAKDDLRTHSFREVKDIRRHLFTRDLNINDLRSTLPRKRTESKSEKPQAFRGKPMIGSRDYDSDTTTSVEDIYEDSSYPQPTSNSTGISRQQFIDENIYDSTERLLSFDEQSCFSEGGSMGSKHDKLTYSGPHQEMTDEELLKKVKEVQHVLKILSDEDDELEEMRTSSLNISALLQMTKRINEDRRSLALELCSQIKNQISERSSTRAGLKQAKLELDNRTMRLEKEKKEIQSSLEKELDRRSSDWSLKLEKFQSEEQRLRERVRELAEQNVSLQREISSLKGCEADTRSRIMNSEMHLNDLTASLNEARTESHNRQKALLELQERFSDAEEGRDCIRESYKEKEKENKELQKAVVRLQRMCIEQDKTISGLREGYCNEIGKQSVERGDKLNLLQQEQIRLTGVEQMLRKEVDCCRNELDSLRHENVCLLDRLQGNKNGYGFSSMKLEKELRERVDCLQIQGLSLLDDHSQFLGKLLDLIKSKKFENSHETRKDFDCYSVGECNLRFQSLCRAIINFRRNLSTITTILDAKSNLEALECHSESTQFGASRQLRFLPSEDELELELKAETLVTRVLREKLCSKELELEQFQSELASSVCAHEVLQTEIQRLQDELASLTHKVKDMELQMLRKDESINQLQYDLQQCTKELTATRSILMKVSEERDQIWEEVKCSRETIMLLNLEVNSLKKKIEALDENILIKEGEIAILKDSLADRPFDAICSPKPVKDFSL